MEIDCGNFQFNVYISATITYFGNDRMSSRSHFGAAGNMSNPTAEARRMSEIKSYHAHVYFDAETIAKARQLCEACRDRFGVEMGRVHEKPVGPHPDWSCQLAFEPDKAGDIIGWLATHRDGLVVLVHPETGQPLEDHRDHGIWMGAVRPLDLSIFDQ